MKEKELTGIEILGRYDGVSHRKDSEGNKYSRVAKVPIADDELCRYGKICKVEKVSDYDFIILSERDDK